MAGVRGRNTGLHANEHAVLHALGELLYATHRQLQAYTGYKAPSHVRDATAGLIRRGYVAGQPRHEARRSGAAEMLYTPTEAGKRYLAAEGIAVLPKSRRTGEQRVDLFQNHLLAITDLMILIRHYCDATGGTLAAMRHDLLLRHDPVRTPDGAAVRPDLWTALAVDGRTGHIWWEVDRGTERAPDQWRGKIGRIARGYAAALTRFGATTMTVATITTTPERVARLATLTREALVPYPELDEIFLFTTAGQMGDPVAFMEGAHWRLAGGEADALVRRSQSRAAG